jgi:hypothetical protein
MLCCAACRDAAATDLLVLSDADEISRSSTIAEMIADFRNEIFGFRLAFYYFYVNYRNIAGPEAALTWTIAATRRQFDNVTPNALRYAVREGRVPARLFDQGGWHFSYLMDEAGVRRKIAAFSHQEFNKQAFLSRIDIARMVREGRDFFDRPGFVWKLMPTPTCRLGYAKTAGGCGTCSIQAALPNACRDGSANAPFRPPGGDGRRLWLSVHTYTITKPKTYNPSSG